LLEAAQEITGLNPRLPRERWRLDLAVQPDEGSLDRPRTRVGYIGSDILSSVCCGWHPNQPLHTDSALPSR
jgi:hypothetical protein